MTAGTPAADEFPEGCVIPVDPGAAEAAHLEALLDRLLGDAPLREAIGRLARAHVTAHHDLGATVARLADFLEEVHGAPARAGRGVERRRVPEGTLGGFLGDEVRWAARDLRPARRPGSRSRRCLGGLRRGTHERLSRPASRTRAGTGRGR